MDIIDLTLTLRRNSAKPFTPRDSSKIEWVVWHHSAGPPTQTPDDIARFHINKGWSGIGYHYLIYPRGEIFKVRPLGVVPACVQGQNTKSICVCFIGNFEEYAPTAEAIAAGTWLTSVLFQVYPHLAGVRGHGEMAGQATSCPGRHLKVSLEAARISAGWAA